MHPLVEQEFFKLNKEYYPIIKHLNSWGILGLETNNFFLK